MMIKRSNFKSFVSFTENSHPFEGKLMKFLICLINQFKKRRSCYKLQTKLRIVCVVVFMIRRHYTVNLLRFKGIVFVYAMLIQLLRKLLNLSQRYLFEIKDILLAFFKTNKQPTTIFFSMLRGLDGRGHFQAILTSFR